MIDDLTERRIRYVMSFVVYVLGLILVFAVLWFGFNTDPVSWPMTVALLGGYFLGRLTRGIEK